MKPNVRIRSEYDTGCLRSNAARCYFVEVERPFLLFWKRWVVIRETEYLEIARLIAKEVEKGRDFHYVNPAHEDK